MSGNKISVSIKFRKRLGYEENYPLKWNTTRQDVWGAEKDKNFYQFDRIFDTTASNFDIFNDIGIETVKSAMDGFDATILLYGQTGSGKTYALMGKDEDRGLIHQSVDNIFRTARTSPNKNFLVRVSYMEIYNEKVTDLFSQESVAKNLDVFEDQNKKVFVRGLQEINCQSPADIFQLLRKAEKKRRFAKTDMNERSSRSHTIFKIVIESSEAEEVGVKVSLGSINFVDLAGSECASQGVTQQFTESNNINKSLTTLCRVINKLTEKDSQHIPFRDSKLTRILKTSLGGNTITNLICTANPVDLESTKATLKFASSAKNVSQDANKNEVIDETTLTRRLQNKIKELENQIKRLRQFEPVQQAEHEAEIISKETIIGEIKEQFLNVNQPTINRRNTWCAQACWKWPRVSFNDPEVDGASANATSSHHINPEVQQDNLSYRDNIDKLEPSSLSASSNNSVFEISGNEDESEISFNEEEIKRLRGELGAAKLESETRCLLKDKVLAEAQRNLSKANEQINVRRNRKKSLMELETVERKDRNEEPAQNLNFTSGDNNKKDASVDTTPIAPIPRRRSKSCVDSSDDDPAPIPWYWDVGTMMVLALIGVCLERR